jgi:threonine dehydrogenase-like Zn-dependent dehydrogenase
MKALQIVKPRQVVMLDKAPKPEPAEGEVLVQTTHAALCGSNIGTYTGEGLFGKLPYPIEIGFSGHENIGVIVKSRCAGWKEGTMVLAQPKGYFGFAEFFISRPPAIALFPQNEPDPARLMVAQPLSTILRAMTRTGDVINKKCVVIGQGPMGLIFTRILGLFGAGMVIAVDKLDWRLEWSKRYGATHVIDASKHDVVEAVKDLTKGDMVDLSVDAAGAVKPLQTAAYLPKRFGKLLVFGMPHYDLQEFPWYHVFRKELQVVTSVGPECGDFFQTAMDMVLDDRASVLTSMVFPRMKWDRAPEAFELYATCAKDVLKLILEM